MASASALISAVLASQIFSGLATSCGAKEPAELPCKASWCSCADLGWEDALATKTCASQEDGGCQLQTCCKASTTASCYSIYAGNQKFCGSGKRLVEPNAAKAAGKTSANNIANCCESTPSITCADIDCTAKGTVYLKKKSGVGATKVADGTCCASAPDDCVACCEADAGMCAVGAQAGKQCAADHVHKSFVTDNAPNAAGKARFSDDASFKTQCCEAKATCSASPTCDAWMKAKTVMPTGKCAGATCSSSECCDHKDNSCYLFTCPVPQVTDHTKWGNTYEAEATDAEKKTACCKEKPNAPTPDKCQAWFDGAAAAKKGATGTTSGAEGASVAMMVLAAIAAVSL